VTDRHKIWHDVIHWTLESYQPLKGEFLKM